MELSFANYSCADGSGLSSNSVTPDFWSTSGYDHRWPSLTSASFTLVFFSLGLPSNLAILTSILWQRLFSDPTYLLLFNLTLAELLMCLLVMPFTLMAGFSQEFLFGSSDVARCKVCQFAVVFTVLGTFTLHILALISLDRFIFIRYPLKYHKLVTSRRVAIILLVLWVYNSVLSTFPLFGFGDMVFQRSIATCTIRFYSGTVLGKNWYYIMVLAVLFIFPFSLMLVTNVWIICIGLRHVHKLYAPTNLDQSDDDHEKKWKSKLKRDKLLKQLQLVKVLVAIIVSSVVTWVPATIRGYLSAITGSERTSNWWNATTFVCILSIAVVHPIVQTSLVPELRRFHVMVLRKVLCLDCLWRWKCGGNVACGWRRICGRGSVETAHNSTTV